MCELLGRSEAELTGLNIAEVTHPDDVGPARNAMARMINGEASTYQAEKRYLRPDGQAIWVLLNASLVRDSEDRPDYVFAQVQDITDRRRAEEDTRSRAAQQGAVAELGRRALSGAPVEHLMHEAVTAVTTCLGLDCAAVLVPQNGDDFVVETAVGCPATMMRTLGGNQARYTLGVGEAVAVADLGTERRFVVPQVADRRFGSGLSVIITVLGQPYGVLTAYGTEVRQYSSEDVNFVQATADVVGTALARRHHEQADQRSNQQDRLAAVGQLAAGVAHDFNNIVSAVGLYAELLDTGQSLDNAGREHLAAIRQQVERATSLIWQILDFAHRSPIEWGEVNLATFLGRLLPVMQRTFPDEVVVTLHQDEGPHLVRGDSTRLQQIFMNLATNARDAMGVRGQLRITLSRAGPRGGAGVPPGPAHDAWVLVEVVDTGPGMSPEVLGRLFEPFFTTKAVGEGTGLGMAQVHGLVGQHGGQIEVESSVGAGTKVSIWLPAIDASPRAEPRRETRISNHTGERLLVVDDDEASRAALGQILESRGYVVTLASDGKEALAYLDRQSASVTAVVSDVMMPGIGGDDLARAVAKRWPAIPVVLISGNPMPQARQRTVAGEPVRLNKPFTSNQLAEALRSAISAPR
jgi:PAS domain S-box-containing protein